MRTTTRFQLVASDGRVMGEFATLAGAQKRLVREVRGGGNPNASFTILTATGSQIGQGYRREGDTQGYDTYLIPGIGL